MAKFVVGGIRKSLYDLLRIGRIGATAAESFKHWLWANRKLIPLVILGLSLFAAATYFGSDWLQSAGSKTATAVPSSSSPSPATTNTDGNSEADSPAGESLNSRAPESSVLVDGQAANSTDQVASSVSGMSESVADDAIAALAGSLKIGRRMVLDRQFARADKILSRALAEHPDSTDLAYLLATSQLANKNYASAGQILADERYVNTEDEVWQILFTSWLLYAPQDTHAATAQKLKVSLSFQSVSQANSELPRIPAWFDARRSSHDRALKVLDELPANGKRSFVDTLFYSVALTHAGRSMEALTALAGAKARLAATSSLDEAEPDSNKALAVRTCKGTITRALVRYTAKLESIASTP